MAEVDGPFISFVVQMLGNVLSQEAKSLRGVKGQVLQMQIELNRMQCFLKDTAARREEGDKTVHNLVVEIREAAYDADDAIDTFIVKVAFRRGTGILNVLMQYSCVVKDYIAIHKVGVEIESIKTKISDITSRFPTHNARAISEGESSSSSRYEKQRLLRQSYPHIMEEDVIGLDEDLTKIVEYLVKERECRVVSIWGMGGLGKTTLAKKVYNYIDVRRHFDRFAWAFISQQCNTREVLEGILIELTSPSHEERTKIKTMSHGELVMELCRVQSQKKCLVVIDEDWKILSPSFLNKKVAGSKILLTTRIQEVASYADQPHELRHLTEPESWELFGKKAFSRRNVTDDPKNSHLRELEGANVRLTLCKANLLEFESLQEVINKCDGVIDMR